MHWAWVVAALLLTGALALTVRHVLPALSTSSPSSAPRHPAREWVLAAVTLAAAGGVVARWWHSCPGYATTVLALLPLLFALTRIDLEEHRLPNRLTLACAVVTTLGLAAAALSDGEGLLHVRRAGVGALALGLFYLALALLGAGRGMGLGDVKLAPSLGALIAWPSLQTWAAGAFGAFMLGGVWGVVLIASGRGRSARMPFGPFMIAGALAAICLA